MDDQLGVKALAGAIATAMAFWHALAKDDDVGLLPLLSPVWIDPPTGFASLYRSERGLARETCGVLGLVSYADVLAPGRLRLFFSPVAESLHFESGEALTVWRLELVLIDEEWRIDRSTEMPRLERIDLSPLVAAAGISGDEPRRRLN